MDWGDVALAGLAVLLVFLGAALTIGIEMARGQLERKQRRQDLRNDFQRTTEVALQETIEVLHSNVWQMYDLVRVGKPIPPELSADHVKIRDRLARLKPNAANDLIRERVQKVYDEVASLVTDIYPPVSDREHFNPALAMKMLALYEPVGEAYEVLGESLRGR